jgi:hypothetical protein
MLDKVPLLSVDYLRVVYASMLFIDKCLRRNRVDNPQVTPLVLQARGLQHLPSETRSRRRSFALRIISS